MKRFKMIFVDEAGFGLKRFKHIHARDLAAALDLANRICEEFNCDLTDVVSA